MAASHGQTGIIESLIEAGASVNAETDAGVTALMDAAGANAEETVALLLSHRANVGAVDGAGRSVLFRAVCSGSTRMVATVIEAGGLAGATPHRRFNPVAAACRTKNLDGTLSCWSAVF